MIWIIGVQEIEFGVVDFIASDLLLEFWAVSSNECGGFVDDTFRIVRGLFMLSLPENDILFQVITSDFRRRIDDSNSNWHGTFLLLDCVKDFKVFCIKFQ